MRREEDELYPDFSVLRRIRFPNHPESMKSVDSVTTPIKTRPDSALRTAVITGIIGIILILLILFSQVILAINPYQDAAKQVNYLLAAAPDLETRLDYSNLTLTRLKDKISPALAYAITTQLKPSAEEDLVKALAAEGIPAAEVRTFISLMEGVANETLSLQAELLKQNQAESLKPVLYNIRQDPKSADTTHLNQIYELSPIVLEDMNDLRRRLVSLSNNMRLITDSDQLEPIREAFNGKDPIQTAALGDARAYYYSFNAWKALPEACESLEIQFAGTVTILDDIFTAVNAARLKDRRMGYSLWEPTALWVDSQLLLISFAAVAFLVIAAVSYFGRGPHPAQADTAADAAAAQLESRLSRIIGSAVKPQQAQSPVPEKQPAPPPAQNGHTPAALQRRAVRRSVGANPRFLVLRASGERETKHLSTEKAFRIGTDPRNAVHLEAGDSGYIEIWVRFARAGFFIEVMYSESPVFLNRQPFTGARALHNGDLIQVLDTSLIFFEG